MWEGGWENLKYQIWDKKEKKKANSKNIKTMFKLSFHQICLRPTMPRENILLHLQGICSSELAQSVPENGTWK